MVRDATTTERARIGELFEEVEYEDTHIVKYSDVTEEYEESGSRYYRLLKLPIFF